jgi:alkylhydroperoxidase/carboxymuconolactone decarboxylase family protein YurZ
VTIAFTPVPPVDPDAAVADDVIEPMLAFIRAASGGRLLNMHLQMARSPLVLDQYTALRRAIGSHATLDLRSRAAVSVAASAAGRGQYTLAVNGMLARRAGWSDEQVAAIAGGRACGDAKIDALLAVVREAAVGDGAVGSTTWHAAMVAGWTTTDLAETYGYLALVSYCDRFVRYAGTELDPAFAATA